MKFGKRKGTEFNLMRSFYNFEFREDPDKLSPRSDRGRPDYNNLSKFYDIMNECQLRDQQGAKISPISTPNWGSRKIRRVQSGGICSE